MLNKFIYVVAITFSMLVSSVALSGAGHDHGHDHAAPPTSQQVLSKASDDLAMIVDSSELVEGKKLDASWKQVRDKKIHKQTIRYYITAFTHPTENKTLYILLNGQGAYLGANFSGNFDGI